MNFEPEFINQFISEQQLNEPTGLIVLRFRTWSSEQVVRFTLSSRHRFSLEAADRKCQVSPYSYRNATVGLAVAARIDW